MSRTLDFIVFGVARSGTGALVRALNLHPSVFCGAGLFHYQADHTQIFFPESFSDTSGSTDQQHLQKIEKTKDKLEGKGDSLAIGHKNPQYYLILEKINNQISNLNNVWIYRSPYGFIQSWNRRESNHKRGNWPAGRVGLYGLIELLCCVQSTIKLQRDVFLFPYEDGLNTSAEPCLKALAFLGADPALFDMETFEARLLLKKRSDGHRWPLAPHEEELLDVLKINELDQIVGHYCGVMSSSLKADLSDYLESLADRLPKALDQAFEAYEDPAVQAHGAEYFWHKRAELRGVMDLARGSKVIAEFQQYGLYDRMRTLWAQRWALKRRLTSFRLPEVAS
ncbi:MAG: hypothetical protein MI824_01815 [Hyphomicrobiales bacterium]|nr:hypothetical protein [Hyphomicrobiales bacterium]